MHRRCCRSATSSSPAKAKRGKAPLVEGGVGGAPGVAGCVARSGGTAKGYEVKRRWRPYTTATGRGPVKQFMEGLDDYDAAEVVAAMREVRREGLSAARHLRGEIYEVRADGKDATYRILFAEQGKKGRVLLALESFKKKTRRTPPAKIELAIRRLRDWERRGES